MTSSDPRHQGINTIIYLGVILWNSLGGVVAWTTGPTTTNHPNAHKTLANLTLLNIIHQRVAFTRINADS
jgi:hypothetical protein